MATTTFSSRQLVETVRAMVNDARGYPAQGAAAGTGRTVPQETTTYVDSTWNGTTGTLLADAITLPSTPPSGAVDYGAIHPTATPVPASYFGLHVLNLTGAGSIAWPALPVGALVVTGTTGWNKIATARGVYDWSDLDALLALTDAHGAKAIVQTVYTPTWASSRPGETNPEATYAVNAGGFAPPALLAGGVYSDLADFVTAMMRRYGSRIYALEVWNEPENFYTGTPAQLVAIAETISQAAKAVTPGVLIVGPAASGEHATVCDRFLQAGGGQWLDALTMHSYIFHSPTYLPEYAYESFDPINWVRQVRGMASKPLWTTEYGWGASLFTGDSDPLAPAFVARSLLLAWWSGAQIACWYTADRTTAYLPLVAADGATLTPAGLAYKTVAAWMTGRAMTAVATAGTVWTATFGDGTHVVWDTSGAHNFTVPAWGATHWQSLAGADTATANGAVVSVGVQPVWFH